MGLLLAFLIASAVYASVNGNVQCKDEFVNCKELSSYCRNQHYQSYMEKHCSLTCGFCGRAGPASVNGNVQCEDKLGNCKDLSSYCRNQQYQSYMEKHCGLTCGFCGRAGPETENSRATATTATRRSVGGGPSCSDGEMTPEQRSLILGDHNDFRSKIARGLEKINDKEGMAPSAKNMYKLTWDCELEKASQAWADTCPDFYGRAHSGDKNNDYGENMAWKWSSGEINIEELLKGASKGWWEELQQYGMGSTSWIQTRDLSSRGVLHFTQMAWGATTQVGCAYSTKCRQRGYDHTGIVCCQYRKRGNMIGQAIFEKGSPCRSAKDCTTYDGSTCEASTGLCVHP